MNMAAFTSALFHKPEHRERAFKTYQKRGSGMLGYKTGVLLRKTVTLGQN